MGYLSTAALVVREHTYYDMLKQAEAEGREGAYRFLTQDASDLRRITTDPKKNEDNIVIVMWDGFRWYNEFDYIRFVEDWMDAVDIENADTEDESGQVSYSFTRFGEDYGDVEERDSEDCALSGYVWISRTITAPRASEQFEPDLPKEQDEDPTTDEELADYLK